MNTKQEYWLYLVMRMLLTLILFQMRGIVNLTSYAEETLDLVGTEMDNYKGEIK